MGRVNINGFFGLNSKGSKVDEDKLNLESKKL